MLITDDPTQAGQILREGGIVVFPTETVFGIGASALNHNACHRIYAIKQRPIDNPLIVHVTSIHGIEEIAYLQEQHYPVLHTFLPGPLTVILPKRIPELFTAGLTTVAVRIPQLPLTQQMIHAAGVPIAAPSANLSGKPSLTRTEDVIAQFHHQVDCILTGPDCAIGLESTVIDLSGSTPFYLRPGAISFEEIQQFLPDLKRYIHPNTHEKPISPGLKYRHYSPACKVILVEDMSTIDPTESGQIGFHLVHRTALDVQVANNQEYAQRLYAFFVDCDCKGLKQAYCQFPQADHLHEALLNRLSKASTS